MKSFITLIFVLFSSLSFAQGNKKASAFVRPYGMAGCGLGSVVAGKKGNQIFAATTNGTSYNQTFGISAGTLNCVDSPSAEVAGRMDQFILVNRSKVQGDIARGQGETIAALSAYMGCQKSSNEVGTALKQNYRSIFAPNTTTNEVTDGIITTILSTPNLSQVCNNLG